MRLQDPALYTPSAVEKHLETAPVIVKLMRSQVGDTPFYHAMSC